MRYNCKVDVFRAEPSKIAAAAVVEPASIQEIIDAIQYASDHSLKVTVIGGGHSTLCVQPDAVIVDLRTPSFQKVNVVDPDDTHEYTRVEVGGGACLAAVGAALKGRGCSVPLGTFTSVGAGLLLQGGIGYLTRSHGLSIDFLEEAEIVDAKGNIQYVTKKSNPDILWALRGAGNQIGVVVTKFVLRTVQQETIFFSRALMARSPLEMPNYLAKVMNVAISLPRSANLSFILSRAPKLTSDPVLMLVYTCHPEGEVELLDSKLGVNDDTRLLWREELGNISYSDSAGHFDLPPGASEETFDGNPPFASIHSCFIGGNHFREQIEVLSRSLVGKIVHSPHPNVRIDFQQTGGAVGDTKSSESAFWNRNQEFSTVQCCLYKATDAGSQAEFEAYQWVDSVLSIYEDLKVTAGTYSVDVMRGKSTTAAYLGDAYGENWTRILRTREKCDPEGMLSPHGI